MKLILDTVDSLERILTIAEGSKTEIAFTAWTKSGTRCTNDIDFFQEFVEEVPRWHVFWCLEPDVWCIDAAECLDSCGGKAFADDAGIFHVIGDGCFDLMLAGFGEDRLCTALYDIGGTAAIHDIVAVPELI